MKPVLAAFRGEKPAAVPFWLMRQAGRYLPEYRELRARHASFLELIYTPEAAAEITLQPLRRFGMDAAIVFSDILAVPDAMGQGVSFSEETGPTLEPLEGEAAIARLKPEIADRKFSLVYETIDRLKIRMRLEGMEEATLIGFAGAPWTLACYMSGGRAADEFAATRLWAYRDPQSFSRLISLLEEVTVQFLCGQIEAGAEAVQLFDSWAGILSAGMFRKWSIEPARRIAASLRSLYPEVPLIGFPRGAGHLYLDYAQQSGVSALSLDHRVPVSWAAKFLQTEMPVQGNLDPLCLLAGGDALVLEAERVLSMFSQGPFIFNLGHGVHKDTPPENVSALAALVKSWKA